MNNTYMTQRWTVEQFAELSSKYLLAAYNELRDAYLAATDRGNNDEYSNLVMNMRDAKKTVLARMN